MSCIYTPYIHPYCAQLFVLFTLSYSRTANKASFVCIRLYKQLAPTAALLPSLTFVHFCLSLWKTLVTASRQTDRQTGKTIA